MADIFFIATSSLALIVSSLYSGCQFHWHEVITHCCLDLHFPKDE